MNGKVCTNKDLGDYVEQETEMTPQPKAIQLATAAIMAKADELGGAMTNQHLEKIIVAETHMVETTKVLREIVYNTPYSVSLKLKVKAKELLAKLTGEGTPDFVGDKGAVTHSSPIERNEK